MINQNNIGINTFFGKIIPPQLNGLLSFLERTCGKTDPEKLPDSYYIRFLKESEYYVEQLRNDDEEDEEDEGETTKITKKNQRKQEYYFMSIYLLKQIYRSGFTLGQLMNPETLSEYTVSRTYFNNFLELMEMLNPKSKEYSEQIYKYIINQEDLTDPLLIIENYADPKYRIVKIEGKDFLKYLEKQKVGVTLSGTLFKVHEEELSMFYVFLNTLYKLRNDFKKQMFTFPQDSPEYAEYNRRQSSVKILMNSTYGLMGASSFKFSNHLLAKAITVSGRLALKTAQFYTEKYLEAKFK